MHSIILFWRIPWTEEPRELQSIGSQRVRHDWAIEHTHIGNCNADDYHLWLEKYNLYLSHFPIIWGSNWAPSVSCKVENSQSKWEYELQKKGSKQIYFSELYVKGTKRIEANFSSKYLILVEFKSINRICWEAYEVFWGLGKLEMNGIHFMLSGSL